MSTVEISSALTVIAGASVIIAIGIAFFRAGKFVDDRIAHALASDEIIRKLSALVKPDAVFDEHGSIILDRGACSFIADRGIYVARDAPDSPPSEICVSFIKHLKMSPLLTSLNPEIVFIRSKRGSAHDWIFIIEYSMTTDDERSVTREYRIEIL